MREKTQASDDEITLLSAADLAMALDGSGEPPLVLEATWGSSSSAASFIPGAVIFDLGSIDVYEEDVTGSPLLISGNYSLRKPQALRTALERYGVQATRRCVVYTQCRRHTTTARDRRIRGHHHRGPAATASRDGVADPIVAARLVWCLAYAGVERVALLDGGMNDWINLGLPLSFAPAVPVPVEDFFGGCGGVFPRHPEYLTSVEEVASIVCDGGALLGDARSSGEYLGEGNDYAYSMPNGRIPGARPARWGPSTFVGSDYYRLKSGSLRPLSEIAALWQRAGLLPPAVAGADVIMAAAGDLPQKVDLGEAAPGAAVVPVPVPVAPTIEARAAEVAVAQPAAAAEAAVAETAATTYACPPPPRPLPLVFYCGSGWRSALAWLIARLLGVRNVANFDGGIFEWCLDLARPVEAGDPQRPYMVRRACGGAGGDGSSALPTPSQGWSTFYAPEEDSCDEGPAGRELERRRQRAQPGNHVQQQQSKVRGQQ